MLLQEILSTSLLELVAGFGYLGGHILLSRKQILGWVLKIIGGSAWVVFLFQNSNYIFAAVTVVVVLAMFYGFYKWKIGELQRTRVDVFFEVLAAVVALCMIVRFVFLADYHLAFFIESVIVVAEIVGTVLLARKRVWGWYSYIVMSLLAGILVIFINPNPAVILGILEMLSIYFYWKGIQNFGGTKGGSRGGG